MTNFRCYGRHTHFQPERRDWICPHCGRKGLHIDEIGSNAKWECELLHEDDYVVCAECGKDFSGRDVSESIAEKKGVDMKCGEGRVEKIDDAALLTAVQDLLCELRIDERALKVMAKGYSPDYPGAIVEEGWSNPHCKIQLSRVVAQKLIDAGVTERR